MAKKNLNEAPPIDYGDGRERMSPDIEDKLKTRNHPLGGHQAFPDVDADGIPDNFEESPPPIFNISSPIPKPIIGSPIPAPIAASGHSSPSTIASALRYISIPSRTIDFKSSAD